MALENELLIGIMEGCLAEIDKILGSYYRRCLEQIKSAAKNVYEAETDRVEPAVRDWLAGERDQHLLRIFGLIRRRFNDSYLKGMATVRMPALELDMEYLISFLEESRETWRLSSFFAALNLMIWDTAAPPAGFPLVNWNVAVADCFGQAGLQLACEDWQELVEILHGLLEADYWKLEEQFRSQIIDSCFGLMEADQELSLRCTVC